MTEKNKQVYVFDFTSYEDDHICLLNWCKKYCKKYCFQLEVGEESGLRHYQGRISLKEKRYPTSIPKNGLQFHFSRTTDENKNNDFYACKEHTRIEGPWKDTDEEVYITKQSIIFNSFELRKYQVKIKQWCQEFDMRRINIIYDNIGNMGKSIFAEHLEGLGLIEEIPPYRLMDDIFQWVYGRPKKGAYFLDLPRGMKKDKLADLYSGIEIIKNGVAYDKRYSAKKVRFDRPRIFVFTNELPCFELMSKDRWEVHKITEDFDLEPLELGFSGATL